jgi:hypothetical protein
MGETGRMLASLIAALSLAAAPVTLTPYPQKIRTFHDTGDPAVPRPLLDPAPASPVGGWNDIAVAADGAVWIATSEGLVRYQARAASADRVQYFAGKRYLPDDDVLRVVPAGTGVWARTRTGIARIELRPMTLAQKAALFEDRIRKRHDRYGLVADSLLTTPGDLSTNRLDPSDNDGLWTAMYAASQCYRYAVTKSPAALAAARKSIEAVLFLEQITGRPGYPARSYIRAGDWRAPGGTWHRTAGGKQEWKSDTSSDEIVGHYYIFSVASDLIPDAGLRRRIAATASRIMDHILDNDLALTDIHGQPTYWGRWSPEYFGTPRGRPDAPLNALELLSFLKTTHRLTGDAKYDRAYRRWAVEMKYAEMTARLKELRRVINYSDEELAMLSFYPLLKYEKDEKLLVVYRNALEQWWENMRRQDNPLWIFIYLAGNPGGRADIPAAARTLYRIPIDMITWTVDNSKRRDIEWEGEADRFGRRQSKRLLPPDERPVMKWNGNPFRTDGGNGGAAEEDGSFFLLPYWMGRHYRYLLGE